MITFKPAGRLGNFMFEAAACYAYSLKYNMAFLCKPHHYLKLFPKIRVLNKIVPFGTLHYHEPSFSYHEIPYHNNIEIEGYYQSSLYFKEYEKEVFELFDFPDYSSYPAVAIHVRRGDYLKYPTKHPVVTMDYINEAIKIFTENGMNHFFVFSDDIKWCKENIKPGNCVVSFSEGHSEIEDMKAMSQCQHQIISNSTFSWWPAFLNRNPNKIVVSPHEDNWFGPENKHNDVSDLIPKEWIRIKY